MPIFNQPGTAKTIFDLLETMQSIYLSIYINRREDIEIKLNLGFLKIKDFQVLNIFT